MQEVPRTLTDAAEALRDGRITSVELTRASIGAADRLDGAVGIYLNRFDQQALAAAERADAELAAGRDRGPLHGIPMGVKDLIACADGDTTAQSVILDREWGGGHDAPVVRRIRNAGAVITGKTTTAEFACGLTLTEGNFPIPRNPWSLESWPGGSSSGSASGIAAGVFPAALGSDSAGSIRMPAAYCGVTGIMPTYGRVPKSGVVPLSYSLDHVGPLGGSALDCAAVLQAIAGPHASDPTSRDIPVPDYTGRVGRDLSGVRVGVVREHHFPAHADPALSVQFEQVAAELASQGATLVDVSLPYWTEMIVALGITLGAEALAYHRVDTHRWHEYLPVTQQVLAAGALVSGADYVQAQRVRRVAQEAVANLFESVDVVICPATAGRAPTLDELLDPEAKFLGILYEHIFTPYWDTLGNPVLAMPMGSTAAGMPLSVQIAGRPFEEDIVLHVATAFQSSTDHHLQRPDLSATVGAVQP